MTGTHRLRRLGELGAALLLGGLAGCAAQPPANTAPVPLVAVLGPGKTEDTFRVDDATCRASLAPAAPAPAGVPQAGFPQGGAQQAIGSQPVGAQQPGTQAAAAPSVVAPGGVGGAVPSAYAQPPTSVPPGVAYLRCMEARGNLVGPFEQALPVAYAYYPAYPVFAGYSDTYPWLYGGFWGFGFFGGRYVGYRHGWYRHGFDRFRDGFRHEGLREGGFRGGGFREGGFREGGFGGGGFGGFRGGGFRR